jgi:hypothetical protein
VIPIALVIALALIGCGDDRPTLVPVTGKVLIDGKPVTAGAIIFHPQAGNPYLKDKPSSLLQLDGSFTMKTFPFGEGVSPGPYKITLAPEVASRIARPSYADPLKTPWAITVPDEGIADRTLEVQPEPSESRGE